MPSLTGLFRVIENENLKTNFKDITISLYKAQRRLESHFKLGLKPKDKPDPDSEDKPDPNKLDPNSTVAQLATLFINMPPLAQEETTYALNKLANACPSHVLTEIDTKKLQDMSTADLVCYVEKLGKNKDSLRKTFLMGLYTGQDIANFLDPLFHRVFVLRHLLGVESGQAKYLAMVSDLIPFVTDDRVKETVQVCMPDPAVSPDPVQGKEDLLESDNKSGEHESSSSSENKKNLSTTREHKLSSTEKEDKTPSPSKPKMVRPFRSKSTKTADKAVDKEKNGDKFSKQSTENLHIQLKPLDESKPNTPESKKKYRNSKGSSPRNQTGVVKHEMQSEVEKESFRYHNPTPTVSNDIDDFLSNPINSLDGIGSNMKPRGISSSNTSRSTGKSIGEIGSNMKQPPKSTNTPKFIEASVPESDAGSNNKKGIASARFSDDPMTPPAEKAEKFFEGVGANMKPVKKKDQSTAR